MPFHNFMLDDLAGCLAAVALFPLFVMIPGYATAWLLDLFEFRQRTAAFRIALSIPLSIAVCPILTYLAGRSGFMPAAWIFYAAAAMYCAAVSVKELRAQLPMARLWKQLRGLRDLRVFAIIAAVWLAITLFSLIDMQIGDRLYYPVNSFDNSVHTEFVHSISATGIPPANPFYRAGVPAALRYHYFWLMMCSLVEQAGMTAVSSRQALIAGVFWCGIALMALVVLYLRLFLERPPSSFRGRALTGCLLLGITGLDIIPTLLLNVLYANSLVNFVRLSVEFWNENLSWFMFSTFWNTHAVASLVACFTGYLLLFQAPAAPGWRGTLKYGLLAALALASSIGASVYVSFVFAVFLALWTGVALWKKRYRETAALILGGLGCAVLISPYLCGILQGPGSGGGVPLKLTIRAFSFAYLMPGWSHMTPGWRLVLANGPMIPINYLLEMGFFFLVGLVRLQSYRNRKRPLSRQELATVLMAVTSILICTFLRSSVIDNNDLGWRGFLIAEFVLLLWGVDVLTACKLPSGKRGLLIVFIVLGGAGSIYDITINRFYPLLADNGKVPLVSWMSADRQLGKRTYASRYAYQLAGKLTSADAAIQFNPGVAVQDTSAMLYSERSFVAGDRFCATAFGGDPKLCAAAVSRLGNFYSAQSQPDVQRIANICREIPASLFIAKDTDPLWADHRSWVWTEKPVVANRYIRLFGCPKAGHDSIAQR